MPMAVRDLVEEWFESDALRAVLAARGDALHGLGPRMPGTAGVLLTDSAGNDGGLAGQTVFARGGPGALTAALAAAARRHGAEIRTGAASRTSDGTASRSIGVTLASGEEIDAPIVVSDARSADDAARPARSRRRLGRACPGAPRTSASAGTTAKVNFALRALPRLSGRRATTSGCCAVASSDRAVDARARSRRSRPAKYGELADEPLIEATIPTLTDPALVDDGRAGDVRHVMSVIVQGVPRLGRRRGRRQTS